MREQRDYSNIKSKTLKKLLIECDKKTDKEMEEWWNRILPRKGSVLRCLVNIELNN